MAHSSHKNGGYGELLFFELLECAYVSMQIIPAITD